MSKQIDPTVERVARAICEADGQNPDATFQTYKMVTVEVPNGFAVKPEELPMWHKHVDAARRFVAAYRAIVDPS